MPRHPRIASEYQHVIVRGNGKQILFESDCDREKFLFFLRKYSVEQHISIVAYCLMENHVHMLTRDTEGTLPVFMKKIGVCYAQYYNLRYERSGHLFEGRYKSESITDDRYFLTVFRYILNNPAKAGICAAEEYRWSSYCEYGRENCFTDTYMLREMIGNKDDFRQFMQQWDDCECMEAESRARDDEWALSVIKRAIGVTSGTQIQQFDKAHRDEALVTLKKMGLSVRQIERLTGINRGIIQKCQ